MAFDNTVYLISGGVNYYLSGSTKTAYTGSGSPWTAENTTPYALSLNDGSPIWVPQAAAGQMVFGGGPPLRNGRSLITRSYDNVTESVGLQIYANSANNAAAMLRQLRRILNTALYTVPCILAVQTGTNTAYYEIYGADVQESTSYLTLGNTTVNQLRVTITWIRSFAGGRLSTGETLLNGLTFTNTGTGANNNTQAYSTGGGDLINEGSPLNIKWKVSGSNNRQVWLASVIERLYSTSNAGAYSETSTTGVVKFATGVSFTNQPYANTPLKGHVMLRFSAFSSLTQVRVIVYPSDASSTPLYTSPWVTPLVADATLLDMGEFDLSVFRANYDNSVRVAVYQRSTSGASATMTFTYMEVLACYTFGMVEAINVKFLNSNEMRVMSFIERTGAPCLPIAAPMVGVSTAGTVLESVHQLHGEAPRYYPGASLYVAWIDDSFIHSTSSTAVVTGTHGALYSTLRGGG